MSQPELESLVVGLIQRERAAQIDEAARAQEARSAEAADLSQGPYGPLNYRVNRISRALGLTAEQELAYYNLLRDYSQDAAVLSEQLHQEMSFDNGPGTEMQDRVHALLTRTEAMEAEMQAQLVQLLDDEQIQRMENLPADLSRLGTPLGISQSDFADSSPR